MSLQAVDIRGGELLARENVLASLDEWADSDQLAPTRVILGGPGVGKSAIIRKWIDRRQASLEAGSGERLLTHMIHRAQDPGIIVQSLIEQCEHIAPDPDKTWTVIDRRRLQRALERAAAGRRLIVVLDALDETSDLARLRELLPSPLPPGVRLLCSSQPQLHANAGFGGPPAVWSLDLDHPKWTADNEATCRAFWASKQTEAGWLTQGRIDEALRAGRGNMLYAVLSWRLLSSLPSDERDGNVLLPDLDAMADRSWQWLALLLEPTARPIRDALGVLSLAREPMLLAQISELANWPIADEADVALRAYFIDNLRPILRDDTLDAFSLYHGALASAVQRRIPGLARLHRAMIPRLIAWLERDHRRFREYAERHLLDHCVQTGSWTEANDLCGRRDFIVPWLSASDPVLAAQLIDRIAAEIAGLERKTRLTRLAQAVRERPNDLLETIEALWRVDSHPRPPPEPRVGRQMVMATASPVHLDPLKSSEEQRTVKLAWASRPGLVHIDFCPAARFGDLRAALTIQPDLLHVGCHGTDHGPLEFEPDPGSNFCPGPKNFVRLIRALGTSLKLVVLNTCHSSDLARELCELKQLVPAAIGMAGTIHDDCAIAFAGTFYGCLAAGYPIQEAFDEASEQVCEYDLGVPRLFAISLAMRQSRLVPTGLAAPAPSITR